MLDTDEGTGKEGWRERENMRTDTSEGPLRTGYRVCLFVQGLRGQICAGKTCRRRMVGEESVGSSLEGTRPPVLRKVRWLQSMADPWPKTVSQGRILTVVGCEDADKVVRRC